jgi:hypothetical protein
MYELFKKRWIRTSIFATQLLLLPLTSGAQVLWDNWYVVKTNGATEGYYNERAEISGTKAKIRVNTWLREGTRIRSENLGATAKNLPTLDPLNYNFRTQEIGMEKTIDGTVSENGKVFSFKIKKGPRTLNPLRAQMVPKIILSSFFPLWVHKNYKKISPVQPREFMTIKEYDVENQVPVAKGDVFEMQPDEFSSKTKTRKIRVKYDNVVNFWYIDARGEAIRIHVPSMNRDTRKTTREEAEKSL